jgi:transcriptional regulator with XRE-family HTH domain
MRTTYPMLTRHQFWKLFFQRVEELAKLRGISADELEAIKQKLTSVKGRPKDDHAKNPRYRACIATAARQLRTEKGLTQREVAQRGKISVALFQGIEDNTLQNFTHSKFYRIGYGLRLMPVAEVAQLLQRVEELQKLPVAEKQTTVERGALDDESEDLGDDHQFHRQRKSGHRAVE